MCWLCTCVGLGACVGEWVCVCCRAGRVRDRRASPHPTVPSESTAWLCHQRQPLQESRSCWWHAACCRRSRGWQASFPRHSIALLSSRALQTYSSLAWSSWRVMQAAPLASFSALTLARLGALAGQGVVCARESVCAVVVVAVAVVECFATHATSSPIADGCCATACVWLASLWECRYFSRGSGTVGSYVFDIPAMVHQPVFYTRTNTTFVASDFGTCFCV